MRRRFGRKAERTNEGYALSGTKAFISGGGFSDLYIVMARTGGEGPKGFRPCWWMPAPMGSASARARRKMGWGCQPTAEVQLDDCRIPSANLLGEEGEGFSLRHGRARWRAAEHRRLFPRCCAIGARQGARLYRRAKGVRADAGSVSGPAVQARRHGNRAAGGARFPPAGRIEARCRKRPTPPNTAPWPSASSPIPRSRSPMTPCSSMAVTAISRTTASKKSCATCAFTRSWKEPTKSCG